VGPEHGLRVDRRRLVERDREDTADEPLEVVVASDEVGLRIDLDHDPDQILDGDADEPLRGDAPALLGGLGEALLAQPVDRRLDVAVRLGEGVLAVHHAGAGLFAQVLHETSRDHSHGVPHMLAPAAVKGRDEYGVSRFRGSRLRGPGLAGRPA